MTLVVVWLGVFQTLPLPPAALQVSPVLGKGTGLRFKSYLCPLNRRAAPGHLQKLGGIKAQRSQGCGDLGCVAVQLEGRKPGAHPAQATTKASPLPLLLPGSASVCLVGSGGESTRDHHRLVFMVLKGKWPLLVAVALGPGLLGPHPPELCSGGSCACAKPRASATMTSAKKQS